MAVYIKPPLVHIPSASEYGRMQYDVSALE
jgi:hypothetical protein